MKYLLGSEKIPFSFLTLYECISLVLHIIEIQTQKFKLRNSDKS